MFMPNVNFCSFVKLMSSVAVYNISQTGQNNS